MPVQYADHQQYDLEDLTLEVVKSTRMNKYANDNID